MIKNIFHEVLEYPDLNKIIKDSLLFTFEKTEEIINGIFNALKNIVRHNTFRKDPRHC